MIVYQIDTPEGGRVYSTKKGAMTAARAVIRDNDYIDEIEVERCVVPPITKDLICDLINSWGGWCLSHEIAATVRRKGKA